MDYGYFDDPSQTVPTYDPGMTVDCPVCNESLELPVKTISLMAEGDNRSYFYRVHKHCWEGLTDLGKRNLDSIIIDFVALRSTPQSNANDV